MRARIVLTLVGLVIASCSGRGVEIGSIAPDFTVKDQEGKQVKLSDLRGNLVLLNFWATWCIPCQEEAPDLHRLNQTFRERKFRMMAVSVDNDWDVIHEFNKKYKFEVPIYLDPGQQAARRYKVDKFPETFIIDGNGAILKHFWKPPQGWKQFGSTLDDLLNQHETAKTAAR